MKLRARQFLAKVRPDLASFESDNVQARLTISICDERGIPRFKDRFFIVTAKVDRQVAMGQSKQDRASAHPDCDKFNYAKDANGNTVYRGQQSVRVLIQHADIEQAYKIGCRAQQAPGHATPPGKKPLCQTWDGVTATRWNGQKFIEIACLGVDCPLRQEPPQKDGRRQPKPAKTQFKLVARLDEEDIPQLLISECTGSDINVGNFASMVEGVTRQWDQLCEAAGINIPMTWFDTPVRMTVYPATGDETRSPRIDYVLDCDIRELFTRRVEWQQRMSGWGSVLLPATHAPLQLSASTLIDEDMDDLDAQEVLSPVMTPMIEVSRPSHEPVTTTIATTPAEQPVQPAQASPFPPTLFERARKAQLSAKSFTAILQEACPSPDAVDTDAVGEVLRRCIERIREKPDSLPSVTAFLAPFASAIHATAPEFAEQMTQLGCPPATTTAPQAEEDNPFTPVEPVAPMQPQTLESAVAGLEMAVAKAPLADKLTVWNKFRLEVLQLSGKLGQRITQEQTSRIAAARPS